MSNHEKKIPRRGDKTIELPYLVSCILYLLDRRYWILGVRYPWQGIRFDIIARDPAVPAHVVLVEAKYRSDGRPVRPYEIERFRREVQKAQQDSMSFWNRAMFITNTRFSPEALSLASDYGIKTIPNVPLQFKLNKNGNENGKGTGKNGGGDNHQL